MEKLFLPSHIYLRSWQIIKFGEEKLGIIGDALRIGREELLGDSKKNISKRVVLYLALYPL